MWVPFIATYVTASLCPGDPVRTVVYGEWTTTKCPRQNLSLKQNNSSRIWKELTFQSLFSELLCLLLQQTRKVLRCRMEDSCHHHPISCSLKSIGPEWLRYTTRARWHVASHAVPPDSGTRHPLQCLPSEECPSPGRRMFPRVVQHLPPEPSISWVCLSLTWLDEE